MADPVFSQLEIILVMVASFIFKRLPNPVLHLLSQLSDPVSNLPNLLLQFFWLYGA